MLRNRFEAVSTRVDNIRDELKENDYRVRNASAKLLDLLQEKKKLSTVHEVLFVPGLFFP
jgi:hypothetical protein